MKRRQTIPPTDDISAPTIIGMAVVVAILLALFAVGDLWRKLIRRGRVRRDWEHAKALGDVQTAQDREDIEEEVRQRTNREAKP